MKFTRSLIAMSLSLALASPAFASASGASLNSPTYGGWPFVDWNGSTGAEVDAYFDRLKAMHFTSVRHLLQSCVDWSKPERQQALLDFVDHANARGLRVIFWLNFVVPGHDTYTGPNECVPITKTPPLTLVAAVASGKTFVDNTVSMLAAQRPRTRAIAGWTIGNGEDPWSADVVSLVNQMADYVHAKDKYHLVGAEAYNGDAGLYPGTMPRWILGPYSNPVDQGARSWYAHVDYVSISNYDLSDGVGRAPYNTAGLLAQLKVQNPDNKPLIIEEYGTVMPDAADTVASILEQRINDAADNEPQVQGTYVWDANANWNVPPLWEGPLRWSPFRYSTAPGSYGIGPAKAYAALIGERQKLRPVAAYSFDDQRSTERYADDIVSSSGKMTLSMGGSFQAAGFVGRSLKLDGVSGYATTTDSSFLDSPTLGISAYVKVAAHKWSNGIACKNGQFCFFIAGDGKLRMWAASNGPGSWGAKGTSTTPLPLNKWTHVEVRYDGLSWRYYLDGKLDGTFGDPGKIVANASPFHIGADGGQTPFSSDFFNGQIDEVKVFAIPRASMQYTASAFSSDGSLPDSSGNGAYGMPSGPETTLAEPLVGSRALGDGASLAFDGVKSALFSSSHDRPPVVALDFYMKASDISRQQSVASQGRDFYGSGFNVTLFQGTLRFSVNTDALDNASEVDISVPYTDTGWHHVHAVYDGYTAKLTLDGGLRGSATSPATSYRPIVYRYNEYLTLGRLAFGPYFFFGGRIAEFEANNVPW
jgi:hypothetical protein